MSLAQVTYLHYESENTPFSFFDISKNRSYFSNERSIQLKSFIDDKVVPLVKALEAESSKKINLFLSIPILEELENNVDLVKKIKALIKSGQIELLSGAGFSSLSILFSKELFEQEVEDHKALLRKQFNVGASGFINSALLYSDEIGSVVAKMGFKYAIVPRIPWFINDKTRSAFSSSSGNLTLYLPETGEKASLPFRVVIDYGSIIANSDNAEEFILLGTEKSKKKLPTYKLPDIVAINQDGQGIGDLVGNNLQRDFLNRLAEIGKSIIKSGDKESAADLLWLGSVKHFQSLSNNSKDKYKIYTELLNMLYDLEIRLR